MGKWWLQKPMRLIQTNLREIDAAMDTDKYIESIKSFSADAVLFNVGGIAAFYPTKLEYHYKSPYLKDDLTGIIVEKLHKENIKLIARFDFSKINECFSKDSKDWYYKSPKGEYVNYNGQVHTCINSYYQQEYAIKIMEEVIDNYPIDGIFFNMIGYVTNDYSGNYYGICQCDNCKRRFKERYGYDLPLVEDSKDPIYRTYVEFKKETSRELFEKIRAFIKSKNQNICIDTYTEFGVDVYRRESNSAIDRPLPEWNYESSDNVKTVLSSWEDMPVSNSAVHFVDVPFRHSGVEPNLTGVRLVEDMANGGWLDYYVIGTLNNQDDRECFDIIKDIYAYHKRNEEYYTGVQSVSDVCLIEPKNSAYYDSLVEYKGIFRMLTEAHIQFDAINDSSLNEATFHKLKKYKTIIMPDVRNMSYDFVNAIDEYVKNGGRVIATGFTAYCDDLGNPLNKISLKSSGIKEIVDILKKQKGTYLRVKASDKDILKNCSNIDIVYLYEDMLNCIKEENVRPLLNYITPCMFGPPEKCYYTDETNIPGILYNKYGIGESIFIPWFIGKLYQKRSSHEHRILFNDLLNYLLKDDKLIETNASPLVEIITQVQRDNKWQLVNLVNHSGQLGTAFYSPLPIHDIKIKLKTDICPSDVKLLKSDISLSFDIKDNFIEFTIPKLDLYEAVLIK